MSESRSYDVWITDRNVVYRGVPFTVVSDWLQEGRLLDSDRVRPSGGTTWQRLSEDPLLTPYISQPEPHRAEDKAEALERLDVEINPRPVREASDDDPDMIPLIDVSLVLLVFFMMTANELLTATPIKTPAAANAEAIQSQGSMNLGIEQTEDGELHYYIESYAEEDRMNFQQFMRRLETQAQTGNFPKKVIINGGRNVPYEKVQEVTIALQRLGYKNLQAKVEAAPHRRSTTE